MIDFQYTRANDVADAVRQIAADPAAKFIAGGTNLIDLMKEDVERPSRLIDISRLPLKSVEETADGGLRIGALVPNSDLAYHPLIAQRYPMLASAILAGASAQLRNMASTGGNLLQRTRCYYFYDIATPCNKREPGSGCSAIAGLNRMHAILGTSEACIATHPSDMCVALAALDATVHVGRAGRERARSRLRISIGCQETTPQRDTNLQPNEIVTAVELPARGFAANYTYLKIRDRLSYAFALVSVAAALELEGDTIKEARLALGGVAHKPWRDPSAEAALRGQNADQSTFTRAADVLLRDAKGFEHNAFKIDLARRAIVRALTQAAAGTPQSQSNKKIAELRASMPMTTYIGTATSRVDGHAKVTGAAKYAGEFNTAGLAHASVVTSTIAKGRIARIDASEALSVEGVIDVLTHQNRPRHGKRR